MIFGSPYCRLCGRRLFDESDLWAGRCNNDAACIERQNVSSSYVPVGTNAVAHEQNRLVVRSLAVSQSIANDAATGGAVASEGGRVTVSRREAELTLPASRPDPVCSRPGQVFLFLESCHLVPWQ